MKFTTYQLIAIAAVLLGALIAANHFAPGSYAQVANYVGILFGIFFLNRHDDPPPPDAGNGGTGLRVIAGGAAVLALAVLGGLAGCGALAPTVDSVNDPTVDEALSKCRGDARAAYHIANGPAGEGMKPEDAYAIYTACKKDAGL